MRVWVCERISNIRWCMSSAAVKAEVSQNRDISAGFRIYLEFSIHQSLYRLEYISISPPQLSR